MGSSVGNACTVTGTEETGEEAPAKLVFDDSFFQPSQHRRKRLFVGRIPGCHGSVEIWEAGLIVVVTIGGNDASVAMHLVKPAFAPLEIEPVERLNPLMASLRPLKPFAAMSDV